MALVKIKLMLFQIFLRKLAFSSRITLQDSTHTNFNILYVGALEEVKGVGILIRAFSNIACNFPEARLILVGSGECIQKYKTFVKNTSLEDKVTFTGQVKNRVKLVDIYQNADLFVHPGIWPEPFGRTILEALSFSVPLSVSNIGAPPEIIGKAGLVFETANIADLTNKINLIMTNHYLREK